MEFDEREVFHKGNDPGEDFGLMTDDSEDERSAESRIREQEEVLKRQFEEQMKKIQMDKEEIKRRTESKKRKKEMYEKLGGVNYENNPNKPGLTPAPYTGIEDSVTSKPVTTSYFLQNLESGKNEVQKKEKEKRDLLRSRVYTFGQSIETQPQAVDEVDFYSGMEIKKRYLSNENLFSIFKNIKVLRLNKLFAKVSPPHFEPPKYANWSTLGILYAKPDIQITSTGTSRYLSLGITDFQFNMKINIFNNELIEKYNKLVPGDIIAVLNADIYVNKKTNSFSLSIGHKFDSILEIGTSKNFGICSHISFKGLKCKSHIDKSKDSLCVYHQDEKLSKTASRRMEFQTSVKITAPVNKAGVRQQAVYDSTTKKSYLIDDVSAPKTDRISKLAHRFSTQEAHKAYFNPSFVNEKALQEKREKQRKDREIQQKKKDMILQKKLQRAKQNEKKKTDLIDEELKELEDIRKRKASVKVDFGLSEHTIKQRREEQKKTQEMLNRIKEKSKNGIPENEETTPFKRTESKQVVLDLDSDESDSDDGDLERKSEAFKRFKAGKN